MYNKLTENDIREMEKEIEHRKLVLRPRLLEDVKETRAHGDLSEKQQESSRIPPPMTK